MRQHEEHLSAVREPPHIEEAWRVEDVCRLIGMKKSWVYEQVALNVPGGLPFRRLGARLRFDPEQVRAWWRNLGPETQLKMREAARKRRAERAKESEQ